MHYALLMRCRQRVAQHAGNLDNLLEWESTLRNHPVQRESFDELHRQKMDAVAFLH
jgi:hypothetical protein